MTDTRFFAILAAMTAAAISVSAYDIDLEPDAAKRRTVTVFKSQGPQTASLYLKAPSPWVIAGSAITAQDDSLWSAVSTTPNTRTHVYQMVNAHSSQQHVSIFGFLTQPGPGPGRNPWFKATVPAVDIDWEAHSGAGHESDEDAWTGLCPVTTDQSRRSKIIVRPLKDDFGLVSGWMTLECWPTDGVRFLKEDGATALWHGASVSYSETPLTLYVDPVPEKAGPFTVTLKGDMDDAFNRPTDYLTGRAVLLDLDVDADNNGAINDADDLLEETPGGILATGTVKQVALRLAPAGLTGTLTLTAVSGGSRIRVWRDAGKTSPLTLPAEWDLSGGYTFPTALYVEGIDASAAVRDVHLCLRYTAASGQYVDDNIRLTILKVDLSATDLDEAVADATEETTGAYVHWNLDNDDASDNTLGAPKRSGADYLQTGAAKVTGENDLKSLAMSLQPDLNQGSVVLNIASAKAKVWKDAEKGSANLLLAGPGDKTWNLADAGQKADFVSLCSSLWVEGVDSGTCDIKLSYKDTSGTEICSDKVKYTFIAADCGRQPKTDPPNERNDAKSTFPNLVHCEWSITAEATPVYNCIAWSAGISDRWFEQVILIGGVSVADHWLGGVHYVGIDAKYGNSNGVFEIQADLDAFYAAEASVTPTATGPGDASVIYYDGYHGAKKKGCTCGSGKWIMFESKCGQWLRLEHVYDQLDGSTCGYGARTRYYK